jgi:hypothetical protein
MESGSSALTISDPIVTAHISPPGPPLRQDACVLHVPRPGMMDPCEPNDIRPRLRPFHFGLCSTHRRRAAVDDFGTSETKAPIRFRTVFVSRRDRERAMTPAPYRGKSRVFRGDGEFGVSAGLRGGAGRTRTGNQTVIGHSRQVPKNTAWEDGRRKDWHSAANRAVVSSSWGDCLSGNLPRRLDAEAGLRWGRREGRAATPEDPDHVCDTHRDPMDGSVGRFAAE